MKRYLVFCGAFYYPLEGWNDFLGDTTTVDRARDLIAAKGDSPDWWQIIDTQAGEVVDKGELDWRS